MFIRFCLERIIWLKIATFEYDALMTLSAFKVGKMTFYLILVSGIQTRYEIF